MEQHFRPGSGQHPSSGAMREFCWLAALIRYKEHPHTYREWMTQGYVNKIHTIARASKYNPAIEISMVSLGGVPIPKVVSTISPDTPLIGCHTIEVVPRCAVDSMMSLSC